MRRTDIAEERRNIEDKLVEIDHQIEVIRSRYGTDPARMPTGQAQLLDRLGRALERLSVQHQELEARADAYAEIRRSIARGAHTESGDGARPLDNQPTRRPRHGDPWKSDDTTGDGYIARAHDALGLVERVPTEDRNRLADMLDRGTPESVELGHYVTRTSNPDYLSGFLKIMRDPAMGPHMFTPAESRAWQEMYSDQFMTRTAMSLTGANGGYLVPFTLDPTVSITNSGVIDPIRKIASQVSIVTDDWNGVTSAGVNAEWLAENTQAADATPTFSQPTITPRKAAAWVFGSYEVLADSAFASELSRLLGDARSRLEAAAFATGNTGATQPRGIVAAVAAVTASIVSSATISSFVIGDVFRVSDAITPRASSNISWLASKPIINKIRQFDTTGGSAFWANLGAGVPPQLLGDPIYECSSMGTVVTTSANILLAGDFREYKIVDRVGMTVVHLPVVLSTNANRPTGAAGWFAYWRVGADIAGTADSFRLLQLHTSPAFTALG